MSESTITKIKQGKDGVRPIIGTFQNAELENNAENVHMAVFKNKKNKTVAAVSMKDTLYAGKLSRDDQLYNNFILVQNRRTGKTRLISVDFAVLSASSSILSSATKNAEPERDTVDNAELNKSSYNELNKQFGSKKVKRATEQKERFKMNVTHDDTIEETVANVEVDESHLSVSQIEESDNAYRPKMNRNASVREEVYVLEDLVPKNVLDSLEADASEILGADLDEFDLHPFVQNHISKLQNSSSDNSLQTCELLLYINCVITFITKPARLIAGKKFTVCSSSSDVNTHILTNFSVISSTGRTRPLSMRDKAVCYILVLSMIALKYQLDIEELSKDIKLSVKKLQSMTRVLGFSALDSRNNKNVMVLKIPLPPPVSITPKNKRKR